MKKFVLNLVAFISSFLALAQEHLPLHLDHKPILQEEVNSDEVLISYSNEIFSLFDDKIDSISNQTAKMLEDQYNLTNVRRYAYWQNKKGRSLFETNTRIVQKNVNSYKKNIPFWLSIHNGRYINSSTATGIIEKHGNKFKIWDKKTAIKKLTPIQNSKEVLVYLHLMEGVFPISDFSFLCNPAKIMLFDEEIEENYTIFAKNISPTQIFEKDFFYIVNLFYYNDINSCMYEINYKLSKNGTYQILNKRLIYKKPKDITNNVLD